MELLKDSEIERIGQWIMGFQVAAVIMTVLLLVGAVAAYKRKKKSAVYVRITFLVSAILPIMAFVGSFFGNTFLNARIGRANDFINLTIHSYVQLTSFPYAQLVLAVAMAITAGKLLDTRFEYEASLYLSLIHI